MKSKTTKSVRAKNLSPSTSPKCPAPAAQAPKSPKKRESATTTPKTIKNQSADFRGLPRRVSEKQANHKIWKRELKALRAAKAKLDKQTERAISAIYKTYTAEANSIIARTSILEGRLAL